MGSGIDRHWIHDTKQEPTHSKPLTEPAPQRPSRSIAALPEVRQEDDATYQQAYKRTFPGLSVLPELSRYAPAWRERTLTPASKLRDGRAGHRGASLSRTSPKGDVTRFYGSH